MFWLVLVVFECDVVQVCVLQEFVGCFDVVGLLVVFGVYVFVLCFGLDVIGVQGFQVFFVVGGLLGYQVGEVGVVIVGVGDEVWILLCVVFQYFDVVFVQVGEGFWIVVFYVVVQCFEVFVVVVLVLCCLEGVYDIVVVGVVVEFVVVGFVGGLVDFVGQCLVVFVVGVGMCQVVVGQFGDQCVVGWIGVVLVDQECWMQYWE